MIDPGAPRRLKSPIWPWPSHDIEVAADAALEGVLMLPVVGPLDVSGGLDWQVAASAGSKSNQLWLNSLPFVHDLVEMHRRTSDEKYWRAAEQYFEDWWAWAGSSAASWSVTFTDEHAVANRSCALVAMLESILTRGDRSNLPQLLRLIQALGEHGDWLAVPSHYARNNHGIMMDRALLQLALEFEGVNAHKARLWAELAQRRLAEKFARTFDQDGCCTENSPEYHVMNVSLFEKVVEFFTEHGLDLAPLHGAPEMLAKARRVAALMLRADKTMPPIGDTQVRRYPYVSPIQGFGCYPTAGMAILKTGDVELTVKCGGSSFTHRHVDDTSITLRYCGADIFVDGGMYSFDITDRVRRHFTSFRAHSGMFVSRFETVRFAHFDKPEDAAQLVDSLDAGDGRYFVAMNSHLLEGVRIERDVFVVENAVVIRDRLDADLVEAWRQQFLLHPNAICVPEGGAFTVTNGKVRAVIRQYGASAQGGLEKNFYSERFMEKSDTNCLVFKGDGAAVDLLTVVSLSQTDAQSDRPPSEYLLTPDRSALVLGSGQIVPIPGRRQQA